MFGNDTVNYSNVFDDEWFNVTEPTTEKQLLLTLNSIANDTAWDNGTIPFSGTTSKTGDISLVNATLYVWFENGSVAIEDTQAISGTSNTTVWSKSVPYRVDDDFQWNILSFSNESYNWSVNNFTYRIENYPNVSFRNPENYYNFSNNSYWFEVVLDKAIDDPYLVNATSYIWFSNGTLFTTSYRSIGAFAILYNVTGTAPENNTYFYNTEAFSKNWISTSKSFSAWALNKSFIIPDLTNPQINITSPIGSLGFGKSGETEFLNWSVFDANLDQCWYDYNNSNTTVTCLDNTTTFILAANEFTITFYANDTSGNLGINSTTWDYTIYENSRVFDETVVQTSRETIKFLGTLGSGASSVSGVLWYNGSAETAVTTQSGSNFNLTTNLDIPSTGTGNASFFWAISFTNATGTFQYNTSESNQTITELVMYECTNPVPDGLTLNFSTYDSTNLTLLNTSLEATFQFYSVDGTGDSFIEYLFQDLNENRSNYMYCLNSSGENVTLDAFISYIATGYDRREYIIDDGIIGNFTQTIPLYLTETALTDIVTITVQDQNYVPLEGAVVAVQRWNIGTNTYSTIGMLTTSSTGEGIIDLELYTTWYRAAVTYEGELVAVTDVQKLSSTEWVITVEIGVDNPYDLFGDIASGLTFDNSTNITSFTWLDSSGYTQRGCLVVTNQTNLGSVELFNSCVVSVSGTINYQLVGDGTYHATGRIFLDGYNQSQIVDELTIRLGTPSNTATISKYGRVISALAIGTAGVIGVSAGSIILGAFLVVLVIFALVKIGFMNVASGFVWGIISILLIIVFLQTRRRG